MLIGAKSEYRRQCENMDMARRQDLRSDGPYGYLMVHFIEDPHGDAEQIYFDLSEEDNPLHWRPLYAGQPRLSSNIGTTGLRDPYIVRDPATGRVYVMATDLKVFGGEASLRQGWDYWSHHGSTNLMVWYSDDLVEWSGPHCLDVSLSRDGTRRQLGMAWAPESLWVPDYRGRGQGAFILYWSSKLFDQDDSDHADPQVYDRVLWGVTTDFTQEHFQYGGVLIDTGRDAIDTTMIQRPLPDGGLRTYRATKDNGYGRGIWLESTDAPQWWEPNTQWHLIQEGIGAKWAPGGNPSGVEGPALYADQRFDRWYLLVDVIPSIGYRPMVSDDLDTGFNYGKIEDFHLRAHTKHGGILPLTRQEYERLEPLTHAV